jgi:hypothetical protein
MVAVGTDVYFTDTWSHVIRKYSTTDAQVTTIAGTSGTAGALDGIGTAAQFNAPMSITSDGAGHLYVVDSLNAAIRKLDLATNMVTTYAGKLTTPGDQDGAGTNARLYFSSTRPGQIVTAGECLIFADSGNAKIKWIDPAGNVATLAGATGAAMDQIADQPATGAIGFPMGIAFVPAEGIYFSTDTGIKVIH